MGDLLCIHTFGGLALEHNGRPITGFHSRKVEALLVYLACTGRPHPREVLAELRWPQRGASGSPSSAQIDSKQFDSVATLTYTNIIM